MRISILVFLYTAVLIPLVPTPAEAEGGCAVTEVVTFVNGQAQVQVTENCSGGGTSQSGPSGDAGVVMTDMDLDAVCVSAALSSGFDPVEYCQIPQVPEDGGQIEITPDIALAAFRRIPLPASTLVVQPPNGRTLVNFETNFYTEAAPFERTVTLLGQQVDLRIRPTRFGWVFGDGASLATQTAGAPYPQLDVTHSYLRKGQVGPSVDTTYAADFRVDGGPWREVAGTVTMPGEAVALEVLTASPALVGY